MTADLPVSAYYADPVVRARIREYCGASIERPVSTVYVTAISSSDAAVRGWGAAPHWPPDALDHLLAAGGDIARAVWDERTFVFHFDIDYLNIDRPGEPFLHPADTFLKLEPLYQAVRQVLDADGLRMLSLMTGRGYHFTGGVPIGDPVVARLAALAPETPAWHATVARRRPAWLAREMPEWLARAYVGAGFVAEFLGHRIARIASVSSPIPVMFNGTIVGSGLVGRECVSIDLSAFGDPLDARHIRVAFGVYERHRLRADLYGARVASGVAPIVAVPRTSASPWPLLAGRRSTNAALDLARHHLAELPAATDGLSRAIARYRKSPLAAFHRRFYERPAPPVDQMKRPVRALDTASLPRCVAAPLLWPNDLLLQPAYIQHVTRYLTAQGWHAREIASLIESRYAADCGWGDHWTRVDRRTRAEFDVRVFAGLLATGDDTQIDFNCRSTQEKGLCPHGDCAFDLRCVCDRAVPDGGGLLVEHGS